MSCYYLLNRLILSVLFFLYFSSYSHATPNQRSSEEKFTTPPSVPFTFTPLRTSQPTKKPKKVEPLSNCHWLDLTLSLTVPVTLVEAPYKYTHISIHVKKGTLISLWHNSSSKARIVACKNPRRKDPITLPISRFFSFCFAHSFSMSLYFSAVVNKRLSEKSKSVIHYFFLSFCTNLFFCWVEQNRTYLTFYSIEAPK